MMLDKTVAPVVMTYGDGPPVARVVIGISRQEGEMVLVWMGRFRKLHFPIHVVSKATSGKVKFKFSCSKAGLNR